jgi:hypothetical protein
MDTMTHSMKRRPRRARTRSRSGGARTGRNLEDVNWSKVRWWHIDRAFAALEPESLISLICAAADSPGCGHRLPSLTALWSRAVTHPPQGTGDAGPSDLPTLLAAARKAAPQLRHVEDCWQPDPRLLVCHAINHDRLRIHPGAHGDPSQLLRIMTSTATAADSFVLQQHGFSLSDLLEAGLRYAHWRTEQLAPAWPAVALARDEPGRSDEALRERTRRIAATPAALGQEELDAFRSVVVSSPTWLSRCINRDRAVAAWEWATVARGELDLCLEPMAGALGTALAVESDGRLRPVPASLVLDALAASTGVLAAEAAGDIESMRALRAGTTQRAMGILGMAEQVVQQAPLQGLPAEEVSSLDVGLGLISLPASRHAFAIGVVSGLDVGGLVAALADADLMLSGVTVERLVESGERIDGTAVLQRVVVYGGPLHAPPPNTPGVIHLHIEDLASICLEARQSDQGHDLVFQFLDELASMPGIARLVSLDAADIWRHWKLVGVLNPSAESDIVVGVDCVPDDSSWLAAATWEPIESVLSAAGLPTVSHWYMARLDDRGHAMLSTYQRDVALVLADPRLIICTSLSGGLPDLGIDPSCGLGVADGVLLTCANFCDVGAGLTLAGERPLIIRVEFTADRPQGSNGEQVAIGVRGAAAPQPTIDLLLGPDWLELLADDPRSAHCALGQAIAHCLEKSLERKEEAGWDATRAKFITAWNGAPPVAMLHVRETTLDVRPKGTVTLPRSHATRARAERTLARAIREHGIAPCRLVGVPAQDVCRSEIVPALNRTLKGMITDWSRGAMLAVAEHLNDAQAERTRAELELGTALAAPWGAHWQSIALAAPEASEQTRPLEYLLELLVAEEPTGAISPDRFDVAEAADLAQLAIEIGVALAGAARDLHSLAVWVQDGGITHVAAVPPESDGALAKSDEPSDRAAVHMDMRAYVASDRAHRLRLREPYDQEPSVAARLGGEHPRRANPFIALASSDVPGSLRSADRTMLAACGTGLDGVNAVLATALCWSSDGDQVALASRAELLDQAEAWSSLPTAEVEAALDRLVIDQNELHNEGVRYWEHDRRRQRLLTRPLIPSDNQLIIMPRQIEATQRVYLRYLAEGRLPWHPADVPQQVRNAFNDYRGVANRELERDAAQVVTDVRLPYKSNVHENEASALQLQLPGEIDLLIADAPRSRLWVCEVKDLSAGFSPKTVRTHIDKFLNDKHYIGKLLDRAAAIEGNPEAAAQLVGTPTAASSWRVIPLMITRSVEVAAFIDDVPVTFTVLADLAATLQSDSDPGRGHTPVPPLLSR